MDNDVNRRHTLAPGPTLRFGAAVRVLVADEDVAAAAEAVDEEDIEAILDMAVVMRLAQDHAQGDHKDIHVGSCRKFPKYGIFPVINMNPLSKVILFMMICINLFLPSQSDSWATCRAITVHCPPCPIYT